MTRFAFKTNRNWTSYKVDDGVRREHTAVDILAELRDWWTDTDNPATGYWSPKMELKHRRHVIVAVSPGDMTEYRMILTNVLHDNLPGKSWVAVSMLNTYLYCADFGRIELDGDGSPYAHEVGYVSSKLRIPEGSDACAAGPVVTQLLGLACQVIGADR